MTISDTTRQILAAVDQMLTDHPDAEVTEIPDSGDYDHRVTSEGVCSTQVCTRLSAQEAADWLTTVRPPLPRRPDRRWHPTDVDEVTCERFPSHRHVIVEC